MYTSVLVNNRSRRSQFHWRNSNSNSHYKEPRTGNNPCRTDYLPFVVVRWFEIVDSTNRHGNRIRSLMVTTSESIRVPSGFYRFPKSLPTGGGRGTVNRSLTLVPFDGEDDHLIGYPEFKPRYDRIPPEWSTRFQHFQSKILGFVLPVHPHLLVYDSQTFSGIKDLSGHPLVSNQQSTVIICTVYVKEPSPMILTLQYGYEDLFPHISILGETILTHTTVSTTLWGTHRPFST